MSHDYKQRLVWEGNRGTGTADYNGYGREHRISIAGKPDLQGSADPMFRGSPELHNPEDLFLAAIAGCHLLSYLALCARAKIEVVSYEDDVEGTLELDKKGGGKFTRVTLHPRVQVARAEDVAEATRLHHEAHARCFIAASCAVPIEHAPVVSAR